MTKQNCNYCKHCWRDESVDDRECMNEKLTENEAETYYANMLDGCPHFEMGENVVKIGYNF